MIWEHSVEEKIISLFLVCVEFEMLMAHPMEVFGSRERYKIVVLRFPWSLKYIDLYLPPGPWLVSIP